MQIMGLILLLSKLIIQGAALRERMRNHPETFHLVRTGTGDPVLFGVFRFLIDISKRI